MATVYIVRAVGYAWLAAAIYTILFVEVAAEAGGG